MILGGNVSIMGVYIILYAYRQVTGNGYGTNNRFDMFLFADKPH
jgi:hypothetical protein